MFVPTRRSKEQDEDNAKLAQRIGLRGWGKQRRRNMPPSFCLNEIGTLSARHDLARGAVHFFVGIENVDGAGVRLSLEMVSRSLENPQSSSMLHDASLARADCRACDALVSTILIFSLYSLPRLIS